MNFIKRGLLSIKGNPLKSVILLLSVFILSSVLSGAYIIVGTSENIEENIKAKIGALITIESSYNSPNSTEFLENPQKINPTYDELLVIFDEIRGLENIVDVDFRTWSKLHDFNTLSFKTKEECSWQVIGSVCHDVQYSGVDSDNFFELKTNNIIIKEGRNFSSKEVSEGIPVILVSDALDVSVGDVIEYEAIAYDSNSFNPQNESVNIHEIKKYEFEVIGTFEEIDSFDTPNEVTRSFDYDQHVFMPGKILQKVHFELEKVYLEHDPNMSDFLYMTSGYLAMDRIQITLDSVDSIDKVNEEIETIISSRWISKDLNIKTSSQDFDKIIGPVKNLKSISNIIFNTSIFSTVIILCLIILIFLRDRRHEIGTFFSLGETKLKIMSQIAFEVLIITILGTSLSLFSAKFVANKLTNTMVNVQTVSDLEYENYLGNKMSQKDIMDEYEFDFKYKDIISIYLISLGTVVISIVIPSFYILRPDCIMNLSTLDT